MLASILPLLRQTRGAAAVEFGLVAPILLLAIMGVFDLGYNMYTTSLMEGSIQKVARDSTIEGAGMNEAQLDARVTAMVHKLAPGATLTFDRTSYTNFSDVRQPEDFTDVNDDGSCSDGEPYEDANGNGRWDADRGSQGFGSAKDAVLYEVTVTLPRPFPLWKMTGQSSDFTMVSRTVLRNQPFSKQQQLSKLDYCA
jgi:Flp pilus assembly pilin Flp